MRLLKVFKTFKAETIHNIIAAEIVRITGDEAMDESLHDEVIKITKRLVTMLDEAASIVDFFKKQDEVKKVRLDIKRTLIDANNETLADADLRKVVMDRFMALAKVKFK